MDALSEPRPHQALPRSDDITHRLVWPPSAPSRIFDNPTLMALPARPHCDGSAEPSRRTLPCAAADELVKRKPPVDLGAAGVLSWGAHLPKGPQAASCLSGPSIGQDYEFH